MPRPTLPDTANLGDGGHTTDHNAITGALSALYSEFPEGSGLPSGGTTGQVLSKASTDDFDTEWVDPPEGGGGSSGASLLLLMGA